MKKTLTALAAAVLAVSAASAYSFTYAPTSSFKAEVSVSPSLTSKFIVKNTHETLYGPEFPLVERHLERLFLNKFTFDPTLSFSTDINEDLSVTTTFDFKAKASANYKYKNMAPVGLKYDDKKFGVYSYSSVADFGYEEGSYKVTVASKMYGTLEFSPSEGSVVSKAAGLTGRVAGVLGAPDRGFQYTSNDFEVEGGKVNFGLSYTKGDEARTYGATASFAFNDNMYTTANKLVANYEKSYGFESVVPTEKNPKATLRTKRSNYFDLAYSFKAYGVSAQVFAGRGVTFVPERLEQGQKYQRVVANGLGTSLSYSYGDFGTVSYKYEAAFGHSPSFTDKLDYVRAIHFKNDFGYKTAKFSLAPNLAVQFATNAKFHKVKLISTTEAGNSYAKKLVRFFDLSATFTF